MEVVTKLNLFLLLEKEIFLRRAFVYLLGCISYNGLESHEISAACFTTYVI
jgi:hypothetical protein